MKKFRRIADLLTRGVSFGIDILPTRRLRRITRKGVEYYRRRAKLEPLIYYEIERIKGISIRTIVGLEED